MADNITFSVGAEDGEAISSFMKLTKAEKAMEIQTMKGNRALQQRSKAQREAARAAEAATRQTDAHNKGMVAGAVAAAKHAKALGLVGAAAGAVGIAFSEMAAQHRHLMEEAQRSNQAASGIREFVALQKPGAAGQKHVKDTMITGALAGVKMAEVGTMAQPIQSATDTNGDGVLQPAEKAAFQTDFGAALKLRQVGVAAQDAQTVVTSGRARGAGGDVSADKLIVASDRSEAGPADFARSVSAMGQFKDTDTALALTTALSKEEKNFGELPTLVRSLGQVLSEASDESKFSKKFGLAGLSESDKIASLRAQAIQTGDPSLSEAERLQQFTAAFKNEGLDETKARAMGIAVRQGSTVASTLGALGNMQAGVADRKVAALRADPVLGSLMRAEETAAMVEVDAVYGAEATAARDERARAQARGIQLRQYGGGQAVNEDGTAKPVEFDVWSPIDSIKNLQPVLSGHTRAALNGMPSTGMNAPVIDPAAPGTAQTDEALRNVAEALRENNTHTAELNKNFAQFAGEKMALGAGRALGAIGNSEERQ